MRLGGAARLAVLGQVGAEGAGAAEVAGPGDADALAGREQRVDVRGVGAEGDDAADALVAEDGARGAQVAGGLGDVGAAQGGEAEADENFGWAWSGDGKGGDGEFGVGTDVLLERERGVLVGVPST